MGDFEHRRAALAGAVAEHLLARGLGEAGLRALARAAGTSDRMLLYYFRDKDELLAEALGIVARRAIEALTAAVPEGTRLGEAALTLRLAEALRDERWGAPTRLWIEVAARAGRGEEPWRGTAGALAGAVAAWIEDRLVEAERVRAPRVQALLDGAAILEAAGRPDLVRAALGQAAK